MNTEVYRAASFISDLLIIWESASSSTDTTDLSLDDVPCIIEYVCKSMSVQ